MGCSLSFRFGDGGRTRESRCQKVAAQLQFFANVAKVTVKTPVL
jgi:hypothetical protein